MDNFQAQHEYIPPNLKLHEFCSSISQSSQEERLGKVASTLSQTIVVRRDEKGEEGRRKEWE